MSALASFSNWRVRNQPCVFASSTAFATMPVPRPAAGVITTLAPRNRINFRRSTLNVSAMVTTSGYPFAAHTMARPIPVFPLVASTTVWPGFSFPVFSASSITPRARRSLTDPRGLKASILTNRLIPAGPSLLILTTGVLPTVSRMLAYLCPMNESSVCAQCKLVQDTPFRIASAVRYIPDCEPQIFHQEPRSRSPGLGISNSSPARKSQNHRLRDPQGLRALARPDVCRGAHRRGYHRARRSDPRKPYRRSRGGAALAGARICRPRSRRTGGALGSRLLHRHPLAQRPGADDRPLGHRHGALGYRSQTPRRTSLRAARRSDPEQSSRLFHSLGCLHPTREA